MSLKNRRRCSSLISPPRSAHDNAKFASSGGDRTAFVWDVTSGETIRRFSGHLGRVNAVALNADASVLASGSFDSTVRLWDLKYVRQDPTSSRKISTQISDHSLDKPFRSWTRPAIASCVSTLGEPKLSLGPWMAMSGRMTSGRASYLQTS